MSAHVWVQMTYVPIIVEANGPNLDTYVEDIAADAAAEQSLLGCWFCHTPLTIEAFETECPKITSGNVSSSLDSPQ